LKQNIKKIFFLIKLTREPIRLTRQSMVGRVGFKFCWLVKKWVRFSWLT